MITHFVKLSVREHLRGHPALLRAAVCDLAGLADLLWPDVENHGVLKVLLKLYPIIWIISETIIIIKV